jgi:sulfur carrier protein ThiS
MKRILILFAFCLCSCADTFIDDAEKKAESTDTTSMAGAADAARLLSRAYVDAAQSTRTVQDVLSSVVFLSAAAAVSANLDGAAKSAIADKAAPGAAATVAGRRLVPKSSIQAMYAGARRMNCIAVTADLADKLKFSDDTESGAIAATNGAIVQARILVRESIVRDIADFSDLFGELTKEIGASLETPGAMTAAVERRPGYFTLDQYLKLLNNCLSTTASPPSDTTP